MMTSASHNISDNSDTTPSTFLPKFTKMKTQSETNILNRLLMLALFLGPAIATAQTVTVYKSPTCGCCTGWVDYLRDNEFKVETFDLQDLDPIKAQYGVTRQLQSCHTALVDDYVVEGHVPVEDIRRMLADRPDITGLTAPGMPAMSPGMASLEPRGYDVLSFDKAGQVKVYSRY